MFITHFWRKLRISRKLGFTFGVFLILTLAVVSLGDLTLRRIISKNTQIVNTNFVIERLVLQMVAGLQAAQQADYSFRLYYPEIGYDEAYELYALDVERQLDNVILLSSELRERVQISDNQSHEESTVNLFLSLAEQYKNSYEAVLTHIESLAAPQTGLEDRLARSTDLLYLYTVERNVIKNIYDSAVEDQNIYFRTRDQESMQESIAKIDRLSSIAGVFFGSSNEESEISLLDDIQRAATDYRELSLQIVVANDQINTQLARIELQTNTILPASEQLLDFAHQQTQLAQNQMRRIQNLTTSASVVAALIALGLVFLIGRLLNSSITRNLEILSQAVSSVRAGNLTARVSIAAEDEIGVLASGFNNMASQLHHLVGNLEDRVAERTSELVEASEEIKRLNDRLQEENVRMESELDISSKIQRMVLPTRHEMSQIDNLEIASYMTPVTEVGGDYYDVLQHDGKVKIGIGDVTGHGLESGVLSLMVQTAVRTLTTTQQDNPVQFMTALNRTIYDNLERMDIDKSLTLSIVDYEACMDHGVSHGEVCLSGQHEYFIVVRNSGEVEVHDTIDLGFPIGLEADISTFVDELRVPLHSGDGVVLYTDGITEAEDVEGKQYGLERLCALLSRTWYEPASDVCQHVVDDVYSYIGNAQVYDDFTLVVMKQR